MAFLLNRVSVALGLRLAAAGLACLFAAPVVVHAQVWMRADDAGVLHFSNERQSADDQLLLRGLGGAGDAPLPADWAQAPTSPEMERAAQRIQTSPQFDAVRPAMAQAADHFGLDHALVTAVVAAESAFNPQAVSPKGAIGLMQVMPATAKRFGVTPRPGHSVERQLRDPETNLRTGARYLAHLIQLFEGQLELAVAAYNAGEGAVMRAGNRVPNYRETRQYVVKVLGLYHALRSPD